MDLKNYLKECQALVDAYLVESIPHENFFPSKLNQATHYSLFAGGKRVRPVLCFAAAEAAGGSKEAVIPVAGAMEMIHTFSLIHDDLPAMDNDDLRRGKPTSHKVFGEAVAILAGDALFSEAIVLLSQDLKSPLGAERVTEVIKDIAIATGVKGMIGGQVVDIEAEGKKINLEELKRLHHLKTGRLIWASVVAAAKVVTDDSKIINALDKYAIAAGVAFQIADDILDVVGGEEIGKDVGSDASKGKTTYASLLGLDGARAEAQKYYKEAMSAIEGLEESALALREIAKYIVERKT